MALFAGGGLTAINAFVTENSQIGRYPTNQREWSYFVKELAKLTVEYEGAFNAIGGGFLNPTTFTDILYYRYGKIVALKFPVQEDTSNAAIFSLTSLPTRIRPTATQIVPIVGLVDNGTPITTCGQCSISTTGVISLGLDGNGAGFTTSGEKGFGDVAGNTVIYTLWDATKID